MLRIIPKVGPFSSLAFKVPTPEAERLFIESFDATVARYRGNFDTGEPIRPGEYRLADEAQKRLIEKTRQHAQR